MLTIPYESAALAFYLSCVDQSAKVKNEKISIIIKPSHKEKYRAKATDSYGTCPGKCHGKISLCFLLNAVCSTCRQFHPLFGVSDHALFYHRTAIVMSAIVSESASCYRITHLE